MIYYVAADAPRGGDGSEKRPFQKINDAAKIARAGDQVLVAPGIYREYVNPVHGGTDEEHRIVYRSQVPLKAVITGAERVTGRRGFPTVSLTAIIPTPPSSPVTGTGPRSRCIPGKSI